MKTYYFCQPTERIVTEKELNQLLYCLCTKTNKMYAPDDFTYIGRFNSHKEATESFYIQQYIKELQERGELKPFRVREFNEVSPKHMSRI